MLMCSYSQGEFYQLRTLVMLTMILGTNEAQVSAWSTSVNTPGFQHVDDQPCSLLSNFQNMKRPHLPIRYKLAVEAFSCCQT